MRKIIGAINVTLDGFCDHTAVIPDEEIHYHYADLLNKAGVILFGRITYQLMEYWRTVVANPTGEKAMDEFALIIDRVPKLVFSHTLESTEWESAKLARREIGVEVNDLKQQPGKDIFVGSRSLIIQLMNVQLLDELQLCIHPVLAGQGLPLFDNINNELKLKLIKTKTFGSGAVVLYYASRD